MLTQKHDPSVRSLHGTVKKSEFEILYEHIDIKHKQRLTVIHTSIFNPYRVCVEDSRLYSVQQILFEGNNKKNWFCV